MQLISYIILRITIVLFGLLPWFVLRPMGNLIYVVLYHIIKYRRKVVWLNLRRAFPKKSFDTLKGIEKRYYKYLVNVLIETLKGMHLRNQHIHQRFILDQQLDALLSGDKKVILVGAHQGNWEWACRVGGLISTNPFYVLYSPLKNKYISQFIQRSRERSNAKLIPFSDVHAIRNQQKGALMLLGDQSPSNPRRAHLVVFFDQPTYFLRGPAYFAKKWNVPIYFVHIHGSRDQSFVVDLHLIAEQDSQLTEKEITQKYAHELEKSIQKKPHNWLWSHRKWKHSPPS